MTPSRINQDVGLTNRVGEPLFVFLIYVFVQFFLLSMSENFADGTYSLMATVLATLGASIAATIAGTWIDHKNGGRFIGRMRISRAQIAMCVCGGAVYSLTVHLVVFAFPYIGPESPLLAKAFLDKGVALLMAWMATILIVAPIGEEMVFRGAIQGYLSARAGSVVAIFVAALLFVLIHVPQLNGYWPAIFAIFGLGVVAGVARERTGSLWGAVLLHIAYNSLTMVSVLANSF